LGFGFQRKLRAVSSTKNGFQIDAVNLRGHLDGTMSNLNCFDHFILPIDLDFGSVQDRRQRRYVDSLRAVKESLLDHCWAICTKKNEWSLWAVLAARMRCGHELASTSLKPRNSDVSRMIENTEGVQHPHDDANYDDDVENFFDLPVHRNIGVDQPQQHPHDDQRDDERNQGHLSPPLLVSRLFFMS